MRQVFQMDRNLMRGGAIMRKTIFVIVTAFVLLILIACGKSEIVKATETAIADIGDVTLESEDSIKKAESIFNGLTDHEKEQVDNRLVLIDARNQYEKLLEEQRLQIEEQERQEALLAAEEEKRIDDSIQKAVDDFSEDMNVDKVIFALAELYDLGNTLQKAKIEEWTTIIEGYCYKGTHFLTLEYVLSNDPAIEYDQNGAIVYTKDNKTYHGVLYRGDNYREHDFYKKGFWDGCFGDYHFYVLSGDFEKTGVPRPYPCYMDYLESCFSANGEEVDWGPLLNGKPYYYYNGGQGRVYTDSLGNKLYWVSGPSFHLCIKMAQ